MIRIFVVIVFYIPFVKILADTNYDILYITKSNIAEYKINVKVIEGDLLFNSYTVKIDAEKHISTTCNVELREAAIQIGDNKKILMALPIKVDSIGSLSYSFNIDKELISTSTITLLYDKGLERSSCNINLGSPVVIELEDWINEAIE